MKDNKNTNTVSSELGEGDLDQVSGGFGGENKPCPDCGHVYKGISANPFAR